MKKVLTICLLLSLTLISWSQKNSSLKEYVQGEQTHPPGPIDPQIIQDQDDMTWNDYHPIPGKNWADPSLVPERKFRMALVAIDLAKNSDGVLSYKIAVRSLDGSGLQNRDVEITSPSKYRMKDNAEYCTFTITNKGEKSETDPFIHNKDISSNLNYS